MDQRLSTIYAEILEKCKEQNTHEFEFFFEVWGVMWYPWFIEINGINQIFSFNDLTSDDLRMLLDFNRIKLKKKYIKDDVEREVYTLTKLD